MAGQRPKRHGDYKEQIIIFDRTPFDNFMYYIMREMEKKHFMYDRNKKNSILMEYGNIIEKEQNKFDLIFKVKRKYENTNESTTWVYKIWSLEE